MGHCGMPISGWGLVLYQRIFSQEMVREIRNEFKRYMRDDLSSFASRCQKNGNRRKHSNLWSWNLNKIFSRIS